MKNVPVIQGKLNIDPVRDGKPLDFSFKNLRTLEEIVSTEQRSGRRLPIVQEEPAEEKKDAAPPSPERPEAEPEAVQEESPQKAKELEPFKDPKAPAIQKLLADFTTSRNAANAVSGPGAEDDPKMPARKKLVWTETTSLVLAYNMIPDTEGLLPILTKVMHAPLRLKWVDLSNNHLTTMSPELCELPELMSLYYHSNYVSDMAELLNLKNAHALKTLTMHGNPIDQLPSYRMWTLCLVPQAKRLDTVLVSKLERDNAVGFTRFIRKKRVLPKVLNPPVPEVPKDSNEDEEGDEAADA